LFEIFGVDEHKKISFIDELLGETSHQQTQLELFHPLPTSISPEARNVIYLVFQTNYSSDLNRKSMQSKLSSILSCRISNDSRKEMSDELSF
jgi:hypothetical protein